MNKINNTEIEKCLQYESQLLDSIQISYKKNKISNSFSNKKSKSTSYRRLLKKYQSNDLMKYALLSFIMLLCSTVLLSIVEWSTFSSSAD